MDITNTINPDIFEAYMSGKPVSVDIPGVGVRTGRLGITCSKNPEIILSAGGIRKAHYTITLGCRIVDTVRKVKINHNGYLSNKCPTFTTSNPLGV